MSIGDYPADYPSSFTVTSTDSLIGVMSTAPYISGSLHGTYQPSVATSGGATTTITVTPNITSIPNTTGGYTYPYQTNYPYVSSGVVWASTGTYTTVAEWTHRIWFADKWAYYMQTSNEAEDILMNKRKIKQTCLIT